MILGKIKTQEDFNVICTEEEIINIKAMDDPYYMRGYIKPRIGRTVQETKISIFDTIELADIELLRLCRTYHNQKFLSEPVKPIHTYIRILFHASMVIGRPYDINMMAYTLSTTPTVVQQAMKRWYKGLISQSDIEETHFISTYLWILGLPTDGEIKEKIMKAMKTYGDIYDGRSAFSIARDYVILYFRFYLELPFSCVPKDRIGIPSVFIDFVSNFETRAKISRRKIFLRHPELNENARLLFETREGERLL